MIEDFNLVNYPFKGCKFMILPKRWEAEIKEINEHNSRISVSEKTSFKTLKWDSLMEDDL